MNNKKLMLLSFSVVSALIVSVQTANAQGWRDNKGSKPFITLFSDRDLQGEKKFITEDVIDLTAMDFNDKTKSLIAQGNWEVCEDPYYRKCMVMNGENRALGSMHRKISSVRFIGGGNNYNNNYNNGYNNNYNNGYNPNPPSNYQGRSVSGVSTTYFPGYINGYKNNLLDAHSFCHAQGKGSAIGYGSTNIVGDYRLADVLCKN